MEDGQTVYFEVISKLEYTLKHTLESISYEIATKVSEIRLVAGELPVIVAQNLQLKISDRKITAEQINKSLIMLCSGSIHSYQKQLTSGYLTIEGGHRVGIAASAVYDGSGNLSGFRNVTALVIRIARNFNGISKDLISRAFSNGICGLLIAGAPSSGKTTLLKDIATQLQAGSYIDSQRVAVIDERGELATCSGCTVMHGYNKADGMLIALRNLSPQIIICDEIGGLDEAKMVEQALNSGVYVIATVHAADKNQLIKRPVTAKLIESHAFKKVAILSDKPVPCSIKEVIECDDLLSKIPGNIDNIFKLYYWGNYESLGLPTKISRA